MTEKKENILLEIGTEETPASYIQPAIDQMLIWGKRWVSRSQLTAWGTPRRLVLFIRGVEQYKTDTVWGPPLERAKDKAGSWNKSAVGFTRSKGMTVDDLHLGEKNGKKYINLDVRTDLTQEMRDELIVLLRSLNFPKAMRWIPGEPFKFARPIRWLVFLRGESVIKVQIAGITADRYTRGHRFFGEDRIRLNSADQKEYEQVLLDQYVIADQGRRRKKLLEDILSEQKKYRPDISKSDLDSTLLDEVCNLVEYPRIIVGDFDASYLEIPSPVLITVMKSHQRYFPVFDPPGRLLSKFIVVANGPYQDSEEIKTNNERVLQARLDDAKFFWEDDICRTLEDRVSDLEGITFHRRLGTYRDKVRRLERLAPFIAEQLGLSESQIDKTKRAALLCKSDLTTSLVKEFTELQGVMGREYAIKAGEDPEISGAIYEHYLPVLAGGSLPETVMGQVLALADKLDSVAGFLSAGIKPSGSQDPYGLRRQTQGIIRLVAEKKLPFRFDLLVEEAIDGLGLDDSRIQDLNRQVLDFFRLRLEAYLEAQGGPPQVVDSVLSAGWQDFQDVSSRIEVLQSLEGTDILLAAATIVERTHNIVRSENLTGEEEVREDLLVEKAERDLFQALKSSKAVGNLIDEKDYRKATEEYARIFSRPLSAFFDEVMVNVDDEDQRKNRMILLKLINRIYSEKIADLSLLQFERGEHVI
jgi:glycyl-tRNA synthetase beta chain